MQSVLRLVVDFRRRRHRQATASRYHVDFREGARSVARRCITPVATVLPAAFSFQLRCQKGRLSKRRDALPRGAPWCNVGDTSQPGVSAAVD